MGTTGRWTCAPCNRSFVSQAARLAHINNSSRHPRCEPCKRGFLDEASKLLHMRCSAVHRHTYCEPCDRYFGSPHALEQHRQNSAAHRYTYIYDSDPDEGWSTDTYPDFLPADDSDDETASTRSVASASEINSDDEEFHHTPNSSISERSVGSMGLGQRGNPLGQDGTGSRTIVTVEASEAESSSAGENGSYLDASSEDDNTSSEEEEVDSDFLEQSSDSESDASDTPFSLTSDLQRSTITRTPLPRSSTSPEAPSASASRASFSVATSASSSRTLATGPASPAIKTSGAKIQSKASGYTCPLCLEQDADPAMELSSVKCGHVFCTPCITRALERKHQCPVCRAHAKTKHLRRIFLTF